MPSEILGHDATVVLIGKINPPIFTPAWLHLCGLISPEDMEQAEVEVIHRQISSFKVSRFSIQVQPNRFSISTSEEPFISIADWITVIFGKTLPHTPLQQAGINYGGHFAAASQKQRHALGRALAPLEPWGNWGKLLDTDDLDNVGGLRAMDMLQVRVPGRERGYRQVHLEPSVRNDIVSPKVGIFMTVNDHFEVSRPEDAVGAAKCVQWVVENFDESISTAKSILADVQEYSERL